MHTYVTLESLIITIVGMQHIMLFLEELPKSKCMSAKQQLLVCTITETSGSDIQKLEMLLCVSTLLRVCEPLTFYVQLPSATAR